MRPSASRLRELAARFLAQKTFTAAAGHALTGEQRLAIATLACLPILHLGFDWLGGWREIIVYPGEFRVKREHHDEHTGVVTEGEDELIGEAWERGPVILSWADVATDMKQPFDGFNVVAHEIAHKLDMLDGAMNGVPRLPREIARREWIETLQGCVRRARARRRSRARDVRRSVRGRERGRILRRASANCIFPIPPASPASSRQSPRCSRGSTARAISRRRTVDPPRQAERQPVPRARSS